MRHMLIRHGRNGASATGIVITNRLSSHPIQTAFQASRNQANGINMVGVGGRATGRELRTITTFGNQFLTTDRFHTLTNTLTILFRKFCPCLFVSPPIRVSTSTPPPKRTTDLPRVTLVSGGGTITRGTPITESKPLNTTQAVTRIPDTDEKTTNSQSRSPDITTIPGVRDPTTTPTPAMQKSTPKPTPQTSARTTFSVVRDMTTQLMTPMPGEGKVIP